MTDRDLALFLHLTGVLTVVSGVAVAAVTHRQARRSERVGAVATLLAAARAGVLLAAPGAIVLVAAGVWLAHLEHLSLRAGWLGAAVTVFGLTAVAGAAGGRRPRQARELAERLGDGPVPPELRRLLDDRVSRVANAVAGVGMLAVLWLMVAKPA